MKLVAKGHSRQEAHEQVRVLSHQAGQTVKREGKENDLVERIRREPFFAPIVDELTDEKLLNPKDFIGRAPQQVERFVREEVEPAIEPYKSYIAQSGSSELIV